MENSIKITFLVFFLDFTSKLSVFKIIWSKKVLSINFEGTKNEKTDFANAIICILHHTLTINDNISRALHYRNTNDKNKRDTGYLGKKLRNAGYSDLTPFP